jgi:hypothetical protein
LVRAGAALKKREDAVKGAEAAKAARQSAMDMDVGRNVEPATLHNCEARFRLVLLGIYTSGSNGDDFIAIDNVFGRPATVTFSWDMTSKTSHEVRVVVENRLDHT